MKKVDVEEAKADLKALLYRAFAGEEVVITDEGVPVVRLVRVEPEVPLDKPRKPGSAKGKGKVMDNFDDPLPDDILRGFGQ